MATNIRTILTAFFLLLVIQAVGQNHDSMYAKYINPENTNPKPCPQTTTKVDYNQAISDETRDEIKDALDKYTLTKFLTSYEFVVCVLLIIFTVLALSLEYALIIKGKIDSLNGFKIFVTTIVIFAVLFLIASGYSNNQIAPATGLLGTIAGYILGKQHPVENKTDTL